MSTTKFLIVLILLIGNNYVGRSQSIDTLCPPVDQLKKVYAAAQQKKVLDSLVVVLNSDIRSYEIAVKELRLKDSTNKEIILTYENMIKAKDEQRALLEGQITVLNKEIKKWKRKNKLTALAGIIGTVGGIVATVFVLR